MKTSNKNARLTFSMIIFAPFVMSNLKFFGDTQIVLFLA